MAAVGLGLLHRLLAYPGYLSSPDSGEECDELLIFSFSDILRTCSFQERAAAAGWRLSLISAHLCVSRRAGHAQGAAVKLLSQDVRAEPPEPRLRARCCHIGRNAFALGSRRRGPSRAGSRNNPQDRSTGTDQDL